MTDGERRRRRPAVSCSLCRRRKIRCDRKTPCNNCVRSKNEACIYETHPSDQPRQQPSHGRTITLDLAQEPRERPTTLDVASRPPTVISHASEPILGHSSATTPTSQVSARDVEAMQSRIRQLEEQLSKATSKLPQTFVPAPQHNLGSTTSQVGGAIYTYVDSQLFGETQVITRSIIHKSRMFGQSHWITGVVGMCRDIFELLEPRVRDETSKIVSGIQNCKAMARIIKSRRTPSWPSPPTADLPPKAVADELVDSYLRTSETVHRVLHIPTFRRDYEALWVSGSDSAPDMAFLVQLKLVLAIGATVYDEQFSLRAMANQWTYEAQTWLSAPVVKDRRSIQFLQTNILLLIARELLNIGLDSVWTSVGSLIRTAVYWGLHRDPAHLCKRTIFVAEMRRRLWNTILELSLHSTIASGAPPFISIGDFDTAPPGNFDDDQLMADGPVPKPEGDLSQMSIAIALRKTFPLRLTISKFLNDLSSNGTYEETLRLDAELRVAYKVLCRTLQGHNSTAGLSPPFAIRTVDCLMLRYFLSLHVPFFAMPSQETAYAFSRKVVVETSLKLWRAVHPSPPPSIVATHLGPVSTATDRNDFTRQATCGSGFFRVVSMQTCLIIAAELCTQLQEDEGLGPVPLRPDLLSTIDDAKEWLLRCIKAGETNVKGYLITCLVAAKVESLRRGLAEQQIRDLLIKVAEDAEATCLTILEEMVAQGQTGDITNGFDGTGLHITPESMDEWDLMMTDVLLNQSTVEPMNWMFNEIPPVPFP
ncbi:hypothetical protein BBP40_000629 [Aspergillus hancockii]|nr:hypothetical protein BBP40_000629 [Aspergillus hancockii]